MGQASCAASVCILARLAALVPRPRVNLTRYHGVFAPNSNHRAPGPGQRFTASTPSPLGSVVNPARWRRLLTSAGTSRPLVSLLGVPV
jgi:hypothetical protein